MTYNIRIGNGYDTHQWDPNSQRPLTLGGIKIAEYPSLLGHSDADVIVHACIDALLGAAGMGDIGVLFPDKDPANKDADSLLFLKQAINQLNQANWSVINVDCTVIADKPNIAKYRDKMAAVLSDVINGPVSIKGKTTEGIKSLSDYVTCYSTALLEAS